MLERNFPLIWVKGEISIHPRRLRPLVFQPQG
jgi:hypothetical protein